MTLKIFRVDADCLYNEGCDCDVPMERWEGMARVILAADVDRVVEENAQLKRLTLTPNEYIEEIKRLKSDLARVTAELAKMKLLKAIVIGGDDDEPIQQPKEE